jgi:hypothetical protein
MAAGVEDEMLDAPGAAEYRRNMLHMGDTFAGTYWHMIQNGMRLYCRFSRSRIDAARTSIKSH